MSLLGIDVGTTGCKAAAFADDGRCLAQAYREYATLRPGPGRAELDSRQVWARVGEAIAEVSAQCRADPVSALCCSSMGESFVPVSDRRELLANSILCTDERGAEHAEALRRDFGQEGFYRINPNLLGPQYSLPKLLWLREHEPELFARADRFLMWGDLVGFMLGCAPATADSLANRTLLLDLEKGDWSDPLLQWAGIDRGRLGRVCPGGTVVGRAAAAPAAALGLPAGVRVVAGGHDQCCNALGCGCTTAGRAACGIGTFECITPVYARLAEPLQMLREGLNIEHHALPGLFVSFIYNQGGALVKWFRDTFAAADAPEPGADVYGRLNRELPAQPTRLLVLPHFERPVSPRAIADSAGAIVGLRTSTPRGEILKAILECETLYFADSLAALRRLGVETSEFIASGGGAKSDAWLQIKADIFGVPFVRPRVREAGTLGAAMLAGLATGVFAHAEDAVRCCVARERVFEPDAGRHAAYREKLDLYRGLYPALRGITGRL